MLLNKKSNIVAVGGIATAVAIMCLFITGIFQFSKLAFCFAASLVCGVINVAYGYKTSMIHYVAVSVLALMFVPDKSVALLYVVIFGNYPIVRFCLDGIKNTGLRYLLKFFIYNIYLLILLVISNFIFDFDIINNFRYSLWMLWIAMIFLLFLYDYIYMPFVRRLYILLNR